MKKTQPANLSDVALKIRPGAFSDNASVLLELVKATAQMGGAGERVRNSCGSCCA